MRLCPYCEFLVDDGEECPLCGRGPGRATVDPGPDADGGASM